MSNNRTGKYIYELDALTGPLKGNEAWIPISQDNLTRRVALDRFREFINGDNDLPSTDRYYSSQKITEIVERIDNSINTSKDDIINIIATLEDTQNNITTIYTDITQTIKQFQKQVNDYIVSNNAEITAIKQRLTNLETNLTNMTNKLNSLIKSGTAIPTANDIADGGIYVQFIE